MTEKVELENGWYFIVENNKVIDIKNDKISLLCPFCGSGMQPHNIGKLHKPLAGFAIDFAFKCPNCSFYATFGVPLPPEKAEKIKKYERQAIIPEKEIIEERLRSWGYW